MTIVSTANSAELAAPVDQATSLLAELVSEAKSDVDMMIGVGLVKDSDAVFFQYIGDKDTQALMLPSGKPLTRLQNVKLTGIAIAEDIGEFNSTKINLYLTTNQGRTVMLTSGLNTIWTQCVITSLMGLMDAYSLDETVQLDTWKGTSKMRPCFAAIRCQGQKISDQGMYDQLRELRADRNQAAVLKTMQEAVAILKSQLVGEPVEVTVEDNTADTDLF